MKQNILFVVLSAIWTLSVSASEPVPGMTMTVATTDGREADFPLAMVSEVTFGEKPVGSYFHTPLYGKKIGYHGDSLVESRTNNGGAFAAMISELTGSEYENRAKSGASVAVTTDERRNVVSDIESLPDDLDLIFIGGGVNDFWINVPLGEFPSEEKPGMAASADLTYAVDETTYTGALESVLRKAIKKWPGKPIVYMIPHKIDGAYWGRRADGLSFRDFTERARKVCMKYGVTCFDAERTMILSGGNPDHRERYFYKSDGVHPNEAGYREFYVPRLISLFSSLVY